MTPSKLLSLGLAALLGTACITDDNNEPNPYDGDYPLSDVDSLLDGAPSNDDLPFEGKADGEYPALFTDLIAFQSPVKSQGSRGVCSIFSTTALMEHLYIKEGTITEPDFSEQFLQWSVKFEVNSFPNTSGSNAYYNLRAIHDYGIVAESVWPYETFQWGSSHDETCTGEDSQPTHCYTNGQATDQQKNAQRFKLPVGRHINSRPESIKDHMVSRGTGVVVGLTFFYQAWNHRRSDLPVNSANWRKGVVLYPNAKDRELSLEKRAGHSILLVGWDDDLEVQQRDEAGEGVVDADGNPVMEKGFFIFKNSWGTGSFGVENPHGDGYGYISMKYVQEYGSAYVSDLPEVARPDEVCGDGLDNDGNGATDCDDTACAAAPECQPDTTAHVYDSTGEALSIPDNDAVGVSSTITVPDDIAIADLSVSVNISHSYRGDLRVVLHRGESAVVLHDKTGGYQDDLVQTFAVEDFDGASAAGEWKLVVTDNAAYDTGSLNSWSIEVQSAD